MILMATSEIGKRIAEALDKFEGPGRMRPADLARAVDISPQRLNGWLNGPHNPPYQILEKMADALGISLEWLLGEQVPMKNPMARESRKVYRSGVRLVPIFGAITAGSPGSTESHVVDYFEMKDWGGEFERWGRRINGFSMDALLQDQDWALFENRLAEPSHVVHAFDAGEDTVKVYRRINGHPWLWPTNPEYEPIDAQGWNIKGVCIGYVRWGADGSETLVTFKGGMRWKPTNTEIQAAENFFQKSPKTI